MSGKAFSDPLMMIASARRTIAALGIDFSSDFDRMEAFLSGPPICAMTGISKKGIEVISHEIDEKHLCTVVQMPLEMVSPAVLADVVIVATPAYAALAKEEAEALIKLIKAGRPARLVVTELEVMGGEDDQKTAIKEIENLRLLRGLKPHGVEWLFWRNDAPKKLADFLRSIFQQAEIMLHTGAFLEVLVLVLEKAKASMQEAERERSKAAQTIQNSEALFGQAATHIHHIANNALLTVRDSLREWRMRFDSAAQKTAFGLSGWISRKGVGDIDDALWPFLDTWRTFVAELDEVLNQPACIYRNEAEAIHRKLDEMARSISIEYPAAVAINPDWLSEKTREAADHMRETDIQIVLDAAKNEALSALKETEHNAGVNQKLESSSTIDDWKKRLRQKLDDLQGKTPQARIETTLYFAIETMIGPRLERLIEVISEDITQQIPFSNEVFITEFKKRIEAVRKNYEKKYNWQGTYADLLTLIDVVDKERRKY